MQMTLNSGKMILALMKSPQKNLFQSWISTFPPMFLLPDVRLWDFAPWVRSVASSAWECRGSDQRGWNLVGKNAADDEWRFDAATFRACIYIWSRCPNFDRQLWMSLPTAARVTHCRPDCILPTQRPTVTEFLNVLFPSVFAQIIFWKVTVVTLYLGLWILGNSYFHSRIISWGQMWRFFSAGFLDWIHFGEEF